MDTKKADNQTEEGKIAPPVRPAGWFVVAQGVLSLVFVSSMALVAVWRAAPAGRVGGVEQDSITLFSFAVAFVIMTVALLLLIRTVRGTKLFGALFSLSVMTGVVTVAYSIFGTGVAVVAVSVAVLTYYRNPPVAAYNLILALGLSGIAAAVGFGFHPVVLLAVMALLAAYDVVAVYFTGHMVRLGRTLLRRKVFFAMIFPKRPSGLKDRLSDVGTKGEFMFLGTGDVILPALLAASSASAGGTLFALPVIAGGALGLAVTHLLFVRQKRLRPMPALPPIVVGCILGFAASLLLN